MCWKVTHFLPAHVTDKTCCGSLKYFRNALCPALVAYCVCFTACPMVSATLCVSQTHSGSTHRLIIKLNINLLYTNRPFSRMPLGDIWQELLSYKISGDCINCVLHPNMQCFLFSFHYWPNTGSDIIYLFVLLLEDKKLKNRYVLFLYVYFSACGLLSRQGIICRTAITHSSAFLLHLSMTSNQYTTIIFFLISFVFTCFTPKYLSSSKKNLHNDPIR